jgi:hypothetical protein
MLEDAVAGPLCKTRLERPKETDIVENLVNLNVEESMIGRVAFAILLFIQGSRIWWVSSYRGE